MIDRRKVMEFWDARARVHETVSFESIANLEQDRGNLRRKIDDESAKVFDWLGDLRGRSVLDLGAGVGQWAFRFAERGAEVRAVERSLPLVELGRKEVERRGVQNVFFECSPAEDYDPPSPCDVVFVSGLFVYLDDDQARRLLESLPRMVTPGGILVVRDGTGVGRRHEIDDRWSEHLQTHYSATYRTPEQYRELLAGAGFTLARDENMFPEGHPLNKYPETRLRLFLFEWSGETADAR